MALVENCRVSGIHTLSPNRVKVALPGSVGLKIFSVLFSTNVNMLDFKTYILFGLAMGFKKKRIVRETIREKKSYFFLSRDKMLSWNNMRYTIYAVKVQCICSR